jgi:hypothetical protein
MDNNELEQFKAKINLVELASYYGYECIQKESSRSSIVMVHPADGDKIVVAVDLDGHSIFFSVRQNSGGGSVIDFVMYREGIGLGGARRKLRNCLIKGYLQSGSCVHSGPELRELDRSDLYEQWLRMVPYQGGYLEGRGLSMETITLFSDRIRLDERGNVAFRHDDLTDIVGWELKNKGFTGFSRGGRKALFGCKVGLSGKVSAPLLVIAESAIDIMSYYQLQPRCGFYFSFAGGMSHDQEELLAWVLNRYSDARIVLATDNDLAGEKYAEQIRQMRNDVVRDCPPIGNDWNDVLNNREARQVGQHIVAGRK